MGTEWLLGWRKERFSEKRNNRWFIFGKWTLVGQMSECQCVTGCVEPPPRVLSFNEQDIVIGGRFEVAATHSDRNFSGNKDGTGLDSPKNG